MGERLDFAAVRATLPHGHPMVLLDRVVALRPGYFIHAVKAVSGSEPCYAGLDRSTLGYGYAYPASLIVESFGQAAAILWLRSHLRHGAARRDDEVLMLAAVRDCRFEGRAFPGDVLHHTARLEHRSNGAAFVSGETRVRRHRIASFGSLLAVVRPASALPVPMAGGPPC